MSGLYQTLKDDASHNTDQKEGGANKKLFRTQSHMDIDNNHAYSSEVAVWGAVLGNLFVTIIKFVAYFLCGSGSMLSEAIHSSADTMNQVLLIIGMKRSQVRGGPGSPLDHHREIYIWALISAVGIFFLGAGVTLHHGFSSLLHPSPVHDITPALLVLLLSLLIEGSTLLLAILSVRKQAKQNKQSFFKYMHAGSDPNAVAVVLEDSVAVIGVVIAMASIATAEYSGDMTFDSIGSILIGLLLGFVAVFLIRKNVILLTGISPQPHQLEAFKVALEKHRAVNRVVKYSGEMVGAGMCRLKAEVEFDGAQIGKDYLDTLNIEAIHKHVTQSPQVLKIYLMDFAENIVDRLARAIDVMEEQIKKEVPGTVSIDLEAEK